MKKLKLINIPLFSVLMFLLLSTIYSCHVTTDTNESDLMTTAEVGVKFGRGIYCLGHGICVLNPRDKNTTTSYDALGKLIYQDGKVIELQFDKSSINASKAKEQFSETFFEVHQDVDFGTEKSIIQKGKYLVIEDERYYILSLFNNH